MNSTSEYAYGQRKTLNIYSVNQYFAVHITVMNNYDDGDNIITNIVINRNIPVFAIITALLFHVIHQKAYEND